MRLFIYLQGKTNLLLEQFWGNIANVLKSGKKHNAFNPFTLFFFVAAFVVFCLYKLTDDAELKKYLIYSIIIVMFFGCLMYLLFYLFKPDRLQSESYLLEDKKLNMIGQKGSDILINPVNLTTPSQMLNEGGDHD